MDLRTVDPVLKDTPDAVVHQIQMRQIRWPYLMGWTLAFSLQQGEMFMFVGEWHDFIDVNITLPGKGRTWHVT